MSDIDNHLRAFGMSNLLVIESIEQLERSMGIELLAESEISSNGSQSDRLFEDLVVAEAAEMAEFYKIFYCLEVSIRKVVSRALADDRGANWFDTDAVPQQIKEEARKRRQQEIDRGVTVRSDQLVDYITFGELGNLINSNWSVFGTIFSSQKAVFSLISTLNTLRGPIAHCCPLADDEKDRLSLTVRDWFRLMS